MSHTEAHMGRLKKVDLQGLSVEDWCKKYCDDNNIEKHEYNDTYKEEFMDKMYNVYFCHNNKLYEAIEHKNFEDDEMYEMTKNEDGTFSFIMRFYNGGTCLSECIEDELKRLGE